jgi:hypothetical protein
MVGEVPGGVKLGDHVDVGRLLAIGLAALLAAACSDSLVRRSAATATPSPTTSAGIDTTERDPPSMEPSAPVAPLFVLQLEDQNGGHPAGIPVRITGTYMRTVLSNGRGKIEIDEPGRYRADIPVGCHGDVFVLRGGGATFGAAEGQTQRGVLEVSWKHRIAPAPPVSADDDGDWTVGRRVEITFAVSDRCSEDRVPNGEFGTFGFDTSANVEPVEAAVLRADDRGNGHLVVRCTAPGDIDVVARDRANPSDVVELLEYVTGYSGVPRCTS